MIVNYFSLIFAARRIPSLAALPEDPLIDVNKQVLTKIGNFQQRDRPYNTCFRTPV
jgi:hypothetical protein